MKNQTYEVDFSTGNIQGAYFMNVPGQNLVSFLLNGLELKPVAGDEETFSILYTGFLFNSEFDTGKGRHFSFSVDYKDPTPSINWQRLYRPDFSISDYMNINFDFIVQPLNYGNSPASVLTNLYYTPKGLLIDKDDPEDIHLVFTGLEQNTPAGPLSLDLYRTTMDGKVECDCLLDFTLTIATITANQGTNYSVTSSTFNTFQPSLSLFNSPAQGELSCTENCNIAARTLTNEEETLLNTIQLYPNPVTGKLYITGAENTELRLYNLQSKLLLQKTITAETEGFDLSSLAPGIYFAKLISASGEVKVEKVVKE